MTWNSYAPLPASRKSLPVISEEMRQSFWCLPYQATLSRAACATRYAEAKKATVRGRGPVFSTGVTHCASCTDVGAVHARGIPADSAPSLPPPVAPLGHLPPPPKERLGRFVVADAKQSVLTAEQKHERKKEQDRARMRKHRAERTVRASGKWTEQRNLDPEIRRGVCACGQPKVPGHGSQKCEGCRKAAQDRRAERSRQRNAAAYERKRRAA